MFLLVSVRHVEAHLGEHQHGVSIEISTSLGETFLRISRIRNIPLPWILSRVFVYVPLSFLRLWTLFTEWFWFLFWCILNDVTETSNSPYALPLPSWALLHLGPLLLVFLLVEMRSIDQSLFQKTKIENWSRHSVLNFLLNSRHCNWHMTAETVFPRNSKISIVR